MAATGKNFNDASTAGKLYMKAMKSRERLSGPHGGDISMGFSKYWGFPSRPRSRKWSR
jgi:hypothetical protein